MLELQGAQWRARWDPDGRLTSVRWTGADPGELLAEAAPFCRLFINGDELALQSTRPAGEKQAGLRLSYPGASVRLFASDDSLGWEIQSDLTGLEVCFPALQAIFGRGEVWPPLQDAQARPLFRSPEWLLPLTRRLAAGQSLTFLAPEPLPAGPRYPADLWHLPGLALPQGSFSAELRFHPGGWRAAFELFRQAVRARFDLSAYQRLDTAWYQDQLVQHFTFLFGAEILNLETGEFELERLLAAGTAEFGGFDGVLAWGGYPRLGIDARTQWDLYDDLPGGREGLRRLGRQARAAGVRLFLPYLPWDQPGEDHAGELAQLLADTEADGVFLDTLAGIDGGFRQAIDALRPGVVFCSEGRARPESLELVTGSWAETQLADIRQGDWSAAPERMPELHLLRFLFPEHRIFIGARHAGGEDRLRMLSRGFFNGVGWMVWQDIFGLALPYTPEAARRLKTYARLWRENASVRLGDSPTPLVETRHPKLFVNEFCAPAKRLWAAYNASAEALSGPLLPIQPRPGAHVVELFSNRPAALEDGALAFELGPQALAALVELPALLEQVGPERVRLRQEPPEAGLGLELARGEESLRLPCPGMELDLSRALRAFGRPQRLRLLARGELLDQIPFV